MSDEIIRTWALKLEVERDTLREQLAEARAALAASAAAPTAPEQGAEAEQLREALEHVAQYNPTEFDGSFYRRGEAQEARAFDHVQRIARAALAPAEAGDARGEGEPNQHDCRYGCPTSDSCPHCHCTVCVTAEAPR